MGRDLGGISVHRGIDAVGVDPCVCGRRGKSSVAGIEETGRIQEALWSTLRRLLSIQYFRFRFWEQTGKPLAGTTVVVRRGHGSAMLSTQYNITTDCRHVYIVHGQATAIEISEAVAFMPTSTRSAV